MSKGKNIFYIFIMIFLSIILLIFCLIFILLISEGLFSPRYKYNFIPLDGNYINYNNGVPNIYRNGSFIEIDLSQISKKNGFYNAEDIIAKIGLNDDKEIGLNFYKNINSNNYRISYCISSKKDYKHFEMIDLAVIYKGKEYKYNIIDKSTNIELNQVCDFYYKIGFLQDRDLIKFDKIFKTKKINSEFYCDVVVRYSFDDKKIKTETLKFKVEVIKCNWMPFFGV